MARSDHSFPDLPANPRDDEDGNCPTCGGAGLVDVDTCDARGEHDTTTEPCPTCGSADADGPDAGDYFDDEGINPDDNPDRYPE